MPHLATKMPGVSHRGPFHPLTPEESITRNRLHKHVWTLSEVIGERHGGRPEALASAANYIQNSLEMLDYEVVVHAFAVDGVVVHNIEVFIPGDTLARETVVLGAHYDTVAGSPGANDNGSGVAALLEIASLLVQAKAERSLRLVFFVNEEPPYFQQDGMGSLRYARQLKARGEKVYAMLSLETIGYFSDEPDSQHYPPLLRSFYPSTGNFLAFVANTASQGLVKEAVASFRRHVPFPCEGVAAPEGMEGIGWSDHWSFWQEGYPAIMVTDTAPFRYPHYHTSKDTYDKVNLDHLARVVGGLVEVALDLGGGEVTPA